MSKKTDVENLRDIQLEDFQNEVNLKDVVNLSKYIVDLSLPIEMRIKALDLYYDVESENVVETINKLIMMYELSGTKVLRSFLYGICESSKLPSLLKSLCAKALCMYDEKDEIGYKAVNLVYGLFGRDVGTPYKIEFVKLLMKNDKYKESANKFFCEIINDFSLNCDYRYKCILGLEEEKYKYFILSALCVFIKNEENKVEYRILASQILLRNNIETDSVERILLSFANDESLDYNLRADATDVLLQLGTVEIKIIAQKIIMTLGVASKNIRTLYDNKQNVHTKEVEDSVKEALEFLQSLDLYKKLTIENIQKEILKMNSNEKIKVSLNRIIMDRALYSRYNCSLSNILLQVWSYICGHKDEEEMKKRLIEELEEMCGTCSSGFASRLVNVISGFGDFSMRISWRDQITGNLTGRINKRIQDMDDLSLQEKVMNEMTLETTEYEKRKHFLKFLRQEVFVLREELYHEFKEYITDTDFDLYFRGAMSMYETGQFI